MCPSVRATLGSRSGPMTINATTPMTRISENPMSNMKGPSRRLFLPRLALDRLAGDLLCRIAGLRRCLALGSLHAFLETANRAAKVLADIAQLLSAEDQHHDQQHNQPVPDAQSTHGRSPFMLPAWAAFYPAVPVHRRCAHADASHPAGRSAPC